MADGAAWRDFERAGWEAVVDPYHRFFGPLCARLADPLLDAVEAGPGTRVLDVCCGPGYVAGQALARGSLVDGIDIAASMIELAARLYPAARFRTGDAEAMPYADDRFDAVVCNIGLHHLSDPARGVAEFARVLGPAGRLALSVWDDGRSALDVVPRAVFGAGVVVPGDIPSPPQAAAYDSADELEPLLGAAGIRLESVEPVTFTQHYPNPQALWDGWLAAAIRTGPVLAAQTNQVQGAARRAFEDLVAPYVGAGGAVELPIGFLVIAGAVC
jgi:SAM-dependent methyltransferase